MMNYKLKVIEDDDGNLCLELTDELLAELGLKLGDAVEWYRTEEGNWGFYKKGKDDE